MNNLKQLHASERYAYSIGATMVALEAGELSEGQAAKLLRLDRVAVRELRDDLLQFAQEDWKKHREELAEVDTIG